MAMSDGPAKPLNESKNLGGTVTRHEEQPSRVNRPESHSEPSRPAISDECAALIQDIRSIKAETRRYMRALFEEYLGPLEKPRHPSTFRRRERQR
jgi:hypothetical protein